jgi:hypothetical protein
MGSTESIQLLKDLATWAGILGGASLATVYFSFLAIHFLRSSPPSKSRLVSIIDENQAAAFGVPLSCVASFCIVVLLQSAATGPITIDVWGFKLEGASGPVALWVTCFLAIILGVKALWRS